MGTLLTALRWLLVPVLAASGCWLGLALGMLLGSTAHSLCPADQLVSGFCQAAWIGAAEAFSQYAGAVAGAASAVLLPFAVAPSHKRIAAAGAFLLGASYASYWTWHFPDDWQYPASALIAGLAALAWTWHTTTFAK